MVRKVMLFSTAALAAVALSVSPVFADQLTLGGDGTATFTGTGSSSGDVITIMTTGTAGGCAAGSTCIGSDSTGSFESPLGTNVFTGASWSFSVPSVPPMLSLLAPTSIGTTYVYGIDQNGGQMSAFSFSGGGGDTVTGMVDWTSLVQTGPASATFNGTLVVSSVTGTGSAGATFLADFPMGDSLPLDYTFSMSGELSSIVGSTGFSTGQASSGEVQGAPEPTTLVLYGAGMLLIGSFFRKYRQA